MRILSCAAIMLAGGHLASCTATASPPQSTPPGPTASSFPEGCSYERANGVFVETDSTIFRQGATIGIRPKMDIMPAGFRDIEVRCATGWRLTGPARLADDRRSFTIAADAPPGSEIVISFDWFFQSAQARYRVIAGDAVVLTGRRQQRAAEGCGQVDLVQDFEFYPDGRFGVTFTPFETYQDYWGRYTFDPATGALTMEVEDGNHVPRGLDLQGRALFDPEGRLILEDMYLGAARSATASPEPPTRSEATPSASGRCRYIF